MLNYANYAGHTREINNDRSRRTDIKIASRSNAMTSGDGVDGDARQVITRRELVMRNVVTGAISYAACVSGFGSTRAFRRRIILTTI